MGQKLAWWKRMESALFGCQYSIIDGSQHIWSWQSSIFTRRCLDCLLKNTTTLWNHSLFYALMVTFVQRLWHRLLRCALLSQFCNALGSLAFLSSSRVIKWAEVNLEVALVKDFTRRIERRPVPRSTCHFLPWSLSSSFNHSLLADLMSLLQVTIQVSYWSLWPQQCQFVITKILEVKRSFKSPLQQNRFERTQIEISTSKSMLIQIFFLFQILLARWLSTLVSSKPIWPLV